MMLHDATSLGVKPSPWKATSKAEDILAAEHVVSNFRERRNEWGYYAVLTAYFQSHLAEIFFQTTKYD